MPLNHKQIQTLIELVAKTEDRELDCDEFVNFLAEWSEKVMNGEAVATANASVRHHLDICPECSEEFRMILEILKESDGEADALSA